jgi:hypothetical protein
VNGRQPSRGVEAFQPVDLRGVDLGPNLGAIRQVGHALTKLRPGGWLVAVGTDGPRQRELRLPIASAWIDLAAGSFKEHGIGVNAAIVVIQT